MGSFLSAIEVSREEEGQRSGRENSSQDQTSPCHPPEPRLALVALFYLLSRSMCRTLYLFIIYKNYVPSTLFLAVGGFINLKPGVACACF